MKLLLSSSSYLPLLSFTLLTTIIIIRPTNGQSIRVVPQRTFVDDAGQTHSTRKEKPKIICSARTALALFHQFKLDSSQIVGIYGNYFPRGSIGNMHDPDYEPYWPIDPTSHELEFLEGIPTLSPTCYHAKRTKCDEIDVKAAIAAKADKWIEIGNGGWHSGEDVKQITAAMGNIPVFISTQYAGNTNPGCITYNQVTAKYSTFIANCKSRSLNDVIKRTNLLANFLGIDKLDIAKDQLRMCASAKKLSDAALSAQRRGIRVMTINPSVNTDTQEVTVYPISPLTDPFLRSYEELGVPLIYPGKHISAVDNVEKIPSREWFTDCTPGQMFRTCNNHTYYPADLWLVEGRRFFFNTPEEQYFLRTFFPDKALLKNQIVHWPLNDGPISYTSAARSFDEMARKLDETVAQYNPTKCVNADVTSENFLNAQLGGLQGGEHACYKKPNLQNDYFECQVADLSGGKILETTSSSEQQQLPEFTALVSKKVVSAKTVSRQKQKTMWTIEENDGKEDTVGIAVVSIMASGLIFFVILICICIISCSCWKGASSSTTGIDKTHDAVEKNDDNSIIEKEGVLPVIT